MLSCSLFILANVNVGSNRREISALCSLKGRVNYTHPSTTPTVLKLVISSTRSQGALLNAHRHKHTQPCMQAYTHTAHTHNKYTDFDTQKLLLFSYKHAQIQNNTEWCCTFMDLSIHLLICRVYILNVLSLWHFPCLRVFQFLLFPFLVTVFSLPLWWVLITFGFSGKKIQMLSWSFSHLLEKVDFFETLGDLFVTCVRIFNYFSFVVFVDYMCKERIPVNRRKNTRIPDAHTTNIQGL